MRGWASIVSILLWWWSLYLSVCFFGFNLNIQFPKSTVSLVVFATKCYTYLVISVLLWWRSRLSIVVVSSVLLWRPEIRQRVVEEQPVGVHSRMAAVVLLWRWISLRGRTAIATLRRRCAVATTTTTAAAVILLSGIIRHGELGGGGEWKSGVSQFWRSDRRGNARLGEDCGQWLKRDRHGGGC